MVSGANGEPIKGYAAAVDRTIYREWDPRHIGWMGCSTGLVVEVVVVCTVYTHGVVVHQQNFIHPNNPDVHTQSISLFGRERKRS